METWESGDEGGPQCQARNALPQLPEQLLCVRPRRPVHAQQRQVVDVLQWNVNVLAHLHRRTQVSARR